MLYVLTLMCAVLLLLLLFSLCCSGTVVRTGPGRFDKEGEGQRKAMTVKPGDKVRAGV